MRWKALGIATAALLAAAALPLAAVADNEPPSQIQPTTTTPGGGTAAVRPHLGAFGGSVVSASSSSVSVAVLVTGPHDTYLEGQTVDVAIASSTKIVYGKGQSSIAGGDLVRIRAVGVSSSSTTLTARQIHVDCNCHIAAGTLGSVGSSSFAVNVSRTGPFDTVLKGNAVTFQVNGSTVFVQGRSTTGGSISDLKTGEKVAVIFSSSGFFRDGRFNWQTATFTATHVRYAGNLQPAPTNP